VSGTQFSRHEVPAVPGLTARLHTVSGSPNSTAGRPAAPGCVSSTPGGALLRLKVQPRASRDEIGPVAGDELRVRVTAPPVDAAANEAVLRFLADHLRVRRGDVRLIRGQTSRHKTIAIQGLSPEEVAARLTIA
jgi:uncharacterized protein (TIGR00251 family)